MAGPDDTWSAKTEGPQTAPQALPPEKAIRSGDRVGRYLVLDRLGVGGMGVVYTAHDPQLDRKVALKLLHPTVGDTHTGHRRLLREAQAMARLRHPNTVAVHDVGTHHGRVFIAMELVQGRTLRAWLQETGGRRPWPEVVGVLQQAAAGLAAAHDAGLVHRDFKPDNVMVSAHGHARVMDFGVARGEPTPVSTSASPARSGEILEPGPAAAAERARARVRAGLAARGKLSATHPEPDQDASPTESAHDGEPQSSAPDAELTRPGALVGTPAYMAPEQLDATHVDARADQFALCVVAFEALYGQRPFAGDTLVELAAHIREGRMTPIPAGIAAPRWLLALILRGLRADPAERHPSMAAIAAALVEIPRRRRRLWLTGAGALVFAGLVGAGALGDRAVCDGAAQALSPTWNASRRASVEQTLAAIDVPFAGDTATSVTREIETYAEAWRSTHEEACRATSVRHEQSAAMLDRRMGCLASRRRSLDALVDVLLHADAKTAEHAVEAVGRLRPIAACSNLPALAAPGPEPAASYQAPHVEHGRDEIARAEALGNSGHHDDGLEALAAIDPVATEYAPFAAELALARGKLLDLAGLRVESEEALREAANRGRAAMHDEVAVDAEIELAFVAGYRLAKPAEGRLWAEIARAGLARLGDPKVAQARLENHLGVVLHAAGDPQAGIDHMQRARVIRAGILGEAHLDTAESDHNLAIAWRATGDYGKAREHIERALTVRRRVLGENHPRVAETLSVLAVITLRDGDAEAARELLEQTLRIQRAAYGDDHPQIASTLTDLGAALTTLGELPQAEAHLREAIRIWQQTLGPDHPQALRGRHNLAAMLATHGDGAAARAIYEEVLAARARVLGAEHSDVARTASALGAVLVQEGRLEDARPHLRRALGIAQAGALEPVVVARTELALAHALASDPDARAEARDLAKHARSVFAEAGEGYAERTAEADALLGTLGPAQ